MTKSKLAGPGVLALALIVLSTLPTVAQQWPLTNGLIVITTRTASDALYRQISTSTLYDADDFRGPGAFSPGDVAMAELLQDHGYSTRLLPEWLLRPDCFDPWGVYLNLNPEYYYGGGGGPTRPNDTNHLYGAQLVIVSGSGAGADMPHPNTNNIPIIMGEHVCIGDRPLATTRGSIFMYGNISSGDVSAAVYPPPNTNVLYMKVTAAGKTHPILQGIPLDAEDRIQIWRAPYPEENAHVPTGGKPNWRYSWLVVNTDVSTVPPGTTVLGRLASDLKQAVFAVVEKEGELAGPIPAGHAWEGRTTAPARLVHFFVNERGSGDSRRAFNNLTDIAKVIFIRACKWAMGETLEPYQPLGLIRVSALPGNRVRLEWSGLATKNYKVLGTANLLAHPFAWQTIAQDIPGVNGPVSVTFDASAATQYAFLRVVPVP